MATWINVPGNVYNNITKYCINADALALTFLLILVWHEILNDMIFGRQDRIVYQFDLKHTGNLPFTVQVTKIWCSFNKNGGQISLDTPTV